MSFSLLPFVLRRRRRLRVSGFPMDWEAESISVASDLTFAVPLFALFFFVVRLTLDEFVFEV